VTPKQARIISEVVGKQVNLDGLSMSDPNAYFRRDKFIRWFIIPFVILYPMIIQAYFRRDYAEFAVGLFAVAGVIVASYMLARCDTD
jgi:hypothetical protein